MKNNELNIEKNKSGQFLITGALSIYTVKKAKEILMKELNKNKTVDLDLSEVKDFDSAGFQLLAFIKREAEGHSKSITVTGMSPEVSSLLDRYNLKFA